MTKSTVQRLLAAIKTLGSVRGSTSKEIFDFIKSRGDKMYSRTVTSGLKRLTHRGELVANNGRYCFPLARTASIQAKRINVKKAKPNKVNQRRMGRFPLAKTASIQAKRTNLKKAKPNKVNQRRMGRFPLAKTASIQAKRTNLKKVTSNKVTQRRVGSRRTGRSNRSIKCGTVYHNLRKYNHPEEEERRGKVLNIGASKIQSFITYVVTQKKRLLPYRWFKVDNIKVDLHLSEEIKWTADGGQFCMNYIDRKYGGHVKVYTDASRKGTRQMGLGVYSDDAEFDMSLSLRASDGLEVYTAELLAMVVALETCYRKVEELSGNTERDIAVFCDNEVIMKMLHSSEKEVVNRRYDLVQDLVSWYDKLKEKGVNVTLVYLPGHKDVPGNTEADSLAKQGSEKEQIDDGMNIKIDHREALRIIANDLSLISDKREKD